MKKSGIIYWGITAVAMAAGLVLSVVKSGDHWAFEWRGAELMAQTTLDSAHELSALQILNRVLLQLQENYVDATRFDHVYMLASSLDELQKAVPELLIVFDKNVTEHPTSLKVTIAEKSRTYSLENIHSLWEMSLRLRDILLFIEQDLPKDAKVRDLEYVLINGMLKTLDPHSIVLSPDVFKEFIEGNRGKFGGLGIAVRMINGVLVVMEPMPGNPPAVRAGLKTGDQIISIDGTPTLNMNISEAVDLLKGEPATTVHLMVMRKGWKDPKPFDIVREEINIPSTETADLGDRIAYIKLKSFQSNSQSDVMGALDFMTDKMGSIAGLILDLRGNPGGLLDQAVQISDDFLLSGTIVTTVGSGERYKKPYNATVKKTQPGYPVVILIDSSSASASEIVAGALKNNDRALILGDTSFGKGSVQVLYDLPDKSALKLTIAQYLTPGDRSIQSVGIVPDIKLVPMHAEAGLFDLYPKTWERREASLGAHLDSQHVDKESMPSYALRYLSNKAVFDEDSVDEDSVLTIEDVDQLINQEPKNDKPSQDPQIRIAKRILKLMNEHEVSRQKMLETYAPNAESFENEESAALKDHLAPLGIDWSMGEQPELDEIKNALSVSLVTECAPAEDKKPACTSSVNVPSENRYEAGESFKVKASVTNKGTKPVYRVVGLSESSLGNADDKEFVFGKIDPGKTVTRDLVLKTNRAASSRQDHFKVNFYVDDGNPVPAQAITQGEIDFSTIARPQPAFKVNYAILDKSKTGMGNSLLDDHEKVTVRVWVSNEGTGIAEKPLVYLKNKSSLVKLVDARSETEALEPGKTIYRDFSFTTEELSSDNVPLELHVYDKSSTQMLVENVGFMTSHQENLTETVPKAANKKYVVSGQAPVFVSPLEKANSLQKLDEGTVVHADATLNQYAHIEAGSVTGWVAMSMLKETNQAVTPLPQTTIATIPRVILDPNRPLSVSTETYPLEVQLEAYAPLKDCYIYLFTTEDHVLQSTKIAYQKLEPTQRTYKVDVPIKPGVNRIRFYVRDDKNSEAYETIQVYRK